MSGFYFSLFSFSLLVLAPLAADWGHEIMSIDAAKHWNMDDRIAHVRGTIVEVLGYDGFKMRDDTGELHVRFTNHELKNFHFHPGERVEVRGRIEREHHAWDLDATAVKLHDDAIIGYY